MSSTFRARARDRSGQNKGGVEANRPPAANGVASRKPAAKRPSRPVQRDASIRPVAGTAGDHPGAHQLLQSIFHGPSAAEFHAQTEDPFYEPLDRLFIKQGQRIVSHVRLNRRTIQVGNREVAAAGVYDLATLPECRGRGCATALLHAAERQLAHDGAVLGLLRAAAPEFFLRRGWVVCGRHSYSAAAPRRVLSQLADHGAGGAGVAGRPDRRGSNETAADLLHNGRRPALNIRLWRRVELAALMRLYDQCELGGWGPVRRSEAYWSWLISRRAYDRIYVAIEGADRLDLDEASAPIVGYAVVCRERIVELMTESGRDDVGAELLARVCGDAIERDLHSVRFDAPPNNSLHNVFTAAGGKHVTHELDLSAAHFVKLFDPLKFLRELCPLLHERAKAAALDRPCELGLLFGAEKHRLLVSRRSVKLLPGKLGRSYLACNYAQLVQMLLGHLDVAEAIDAGRLEASTRVAATTAAALFPRFSFWRPPWDDMPA